MKRDWRVRRVTYGHGSGGLECVICLANDYQGELVHKTGCDEVARAVLRVRMGHGFHSHHEQHSSGPDPYGYQQQGFAPERDHGQGGS